MKTNSIGYVVMVAAGIWIALGVLMVISVWICMSCGVLWAQTPLILTDIPSSPNPVGSGARALGMGGAFIAVADDSTAASWNPGGLTQLGKPELSMVGGYAYRSDDNEFERHTEASGIQAIDKYTLNYLSAVYPFRGLNRNMVVSINYQHQFDFKREWQFDYQDPAPIYDGLQQVTYQQNGALYALGLAYAIQVIPSISTGLTLNYWGNTLYPNEWEQHYHRHGNLKSLTGIAGKFSSNKTEEYTFDGWNAVFGFLWKISQNWTLGGVFKTPFTAKIHHTLQIESDQQFTGNPPFHHEAFQEYDEQLRMPMSYGMGAAWRLSDRLTVSADAYRTHWNEFEYRDAQGNKTSPISGLAMSVSDMDPATWFRMGAEYLWIDEKTVIPLRVGMFYDPAPSEGSADDYYGFSLGTGMAYQWVVWDIAYQFRFGNESHSMQHLGISQDVQEHTVYTSLIVHF